jgi:hypothetical protein
MVATSLAKTVKRTTSLRLPPKGFLSRIQATDLLGVSHFTLMEWERKGMVHPITARSRTSNHECIYYDATELAALPITRNKYKLDPGEVASRVFKMLREGAALDEIVIELRLEPAIVEDLRQQWFESGSKIMAVSERSRLELERLLGGGKIENENDLVQLTRAVVAPETKP